MPCSKRYAEAEAILKRGAKFQGEEEKVQNLDVKAKLQQRRGSKPHHHQHQPKDTIFSLFKTAKLRKYTAMMYLVSQTYAYALNVNKFRSGSRTGSPTTASA